MGKVFTSDPELDNTRFYTVTRLIHNYTSSDYDKPDNGYSDDQLCAQNYQDRAHGIRDVFPRIPQFRK